jgi:hypothetical protein
MGTVVSNMAEADIEGARVVMRRLMWNLNDESGGIGWGSPEAMGEIMACSEKLAKEYAHILKSYLNPQGNYLEHPVLQRGVLWGLGRLAHESPRRVEDAGPFMIPFLSSKDPYHRGLAAWALQSMPGGIPAFALKSLLCDHATISLYSHQRIRGYTIKELVSATVL